MEDRTYPTPEKDYKSTTEEEFSRLCEELNGEIPYGLTNDYMFHTVFQKSSLALQSLTAAALGVKTEEITSCELLNPILIGDTIDSKSCVLDMHVCVNHEKKLDMEMEMWGIVNWAKRSMFYLCKMYTELKPGEDYNAAKPCVHISFIKRSPFDVTKPIVEEPDSTAEEHDGIPARQLEAAVALEEIDKDGSARKQAEKKAGKFVSRYVFMDPEDGQVYTDDLSLTLVDMSVLAEELEKAEKPEGLTQEESRKLDETRQLRNWIRLIRAENWEEAFKVAKESKAMMEAVVTMHQLSEDEKVKLQCLAREKYEGDMHGAAMYGKKNGMDQLNSLNRQLAKAGRFEDLQRSFTDSAYQQKLLKEHNLYF